jgi:hypothetical protein
MIYGYSSFSTAGACEAALSIEKFPLPFVRGSKNDPATCSDKPDADN